MYSINCQQKVGEHIFDAVMSKHLIFPEKKKEI